MNKGENEKNSPGKVSTSKDLQYDINLTYISTTKMVGRHEK